MQRSLRLLAMLLFPMMAQTAVGGTVGSQAAPSSEGLVIGVIELTHLFQKDKRGLYDQFFAQLQKQGLIKDWHVLPSKRSLRMIKNKEIDCKAPISPSIARKLGFKQGELSFSKPFNYTLGILLGPLGHPALKDTSLLKQQTVGTVNLGKLFGIPDNIHFIQAPVKSYQQLVALMQRGRLQFGYFIAPDIYFTQSVANYFQTNTHDRLEIWHGVESIGCNIEKADQLQRLNPAIDQFIIKNRHHAVLGPVIDAFLADTKQP